MKLNSAGFNRFLNQPNPKVFITLIYGVDTGQVSERVAAIKKLWLGGLEDSFSVSIFSTGQLASKDNDLTDELAAYTLTGGARLVHLKHPNNEDNKAILTALNAFGGEKPLPVAKLVIEAGALPVSNLLRKALEQDKHHAICVACYPDRPGDVMRNCKTILADAGHQIEPDALDLLVASLPADRRILRLELEKLLCFIADQPNKTVVLSDVQAVIAQAGDGSLDKLVFATLEGRAREADQALWRILEAGQAPVMILRAISRQLYRLHAVLSSAKSGQSISTAMAKLRPPVFVMHREQFAHQCQLWTLSKLEKALHRAAEAERALKSPLGADNSVLGRFVLAVSSLNH